MQDKRSQAMACGLDPSGGSDEDPQNIHDGESYSSSSRLDTDAGHKSIGRLCRVHVSIRPINYSLRSRIGCLMSEAVIPGGDNQLSHAEA